MNLNILGSSSSGNCYIIQNNEEALILECGVSLLKAKKILNFNTSKVVGVLVTHRHNDHAGFAKEYEKCFPVYTIKDVIENKGLKRAIEICAEKGFRVGNFKVLPFHAAHDTPIVGFIINHSDFGNMMFLTDSFLCDYTFDNLNHILIEANYSDACLDESVRNGLHWKVKERVMTSHMSLDTCKKVLGFQNLEKVYNIVLIHLSSQNSDQKEFYDVISRATGKPITIAKEGLEIELINSIY